MSRAAQASLIVPGVALVAFVWRMSRWPEDGMTPWLRWAQPLLVCAVVSVAITLAVGGVAAVRGTGRRPSRRLAIGSWALGGGLLVAMPVTASWSDGCNGHDATMPAVLAPLNLATDPVHGPTYNDISTLVLCSDTPIRFRGGRLDLG